jgi:hypothetical protein
MIRGKDREIGEGIYGVMDGGINWRNTHERMK